MPVPGDDPYTDFYGWLEAQQYRLAKQRDADLRRELLLWRLERGEKWLAARDPERLAIRLLRAEIDLRRRTG